MCDDRENLTKGNASASAEGNTVGSSSHFIEHTMNQQERSVVIGSILGDGFLQATGMRNARLRLEHSAKQKEYITWKWSVLKRYMQDRPKKLIRFHPTWKKTYVYYRCQSHSTPILGAYRRLFYTGTSRCVPKELGKLLTPEALAVWFMDDGYYYARDKTAYIYLPQYQQRDRERLTQTLATVYGLHPQVEIKTRGSINLKFPVTETKRLIKIIAPHVIQSMRYKLGEEPRID